MTTFTYLIVEDEALPRQDLIDHLAKAWQDDRLNLVEAALHLLQSDK